MMITNAGLKAWIGVRWKRGDASIPTTKQPLKDMKDSMTDRQPVFDLKDLLVARKHFSSLEEADEFVTQYHDDLVWKLKQKPDHLTRRRRRD